MGGFGGNDQVDPSESLTGDNTEDPLDAGYSPPDRASHSWRGDTADEAREGESLDQHLAEEEPDVWVDDDDDVEPDRRAGRLVAPDEGAHERQGEGRDRHRRRPGRLRRERRGGRHAHRRRGPRRILMQLTKFTHACVRLDDGDRTLVIDPACSARSSEALDGAAAVLITHEHPDHIDADKVRAALRRGFAAAAVGAGVGRRDAR